MVLKRIYSNGATVGNLYRITIAGGNGTEKCEIYHASSHWTLNGPGISRQAFTYKGGEILLKWYTSTGFFAYIGGEYHNGSNYIADFSKGPDDPNQFVVDRRISENTEPRYLERLTQLSTNTSHLTARSNKSL